MMKCQIRQKDGKTQCGQELVFDPHGSMSKGVLRCPQHPEETEIEVITCHSCFRQHQQVSEDMGLWHPNESCQCACHKVQETATDENTAYLLDRLSKQIQSINNNVNDKLQVLTSRIEKLESAKK